MNVQDILTTLKKLGKPHTAAIYKCRGSGDKIDHALAMELWKTGNAEARILALQVADPAKLTRSASSAVTCPGSWPAARLPRK